MLEGGLCNDQEEGGPGPFDATIFEVCMTSTTTLAQCAVAQWMMPRSIRPHPATRLNVFHECWPECWHTCNARSIWESTLNNACISCRAPGPKPSQEPNQKETVPQEKVPANANVCQKCPLWRQYCVLFEGIAFKMCRAPPIVP